MEFWDNVAGIYDAAEALNGKVYRQITELVTKLTPAGARVLDCAAGTGQLSFAAAKKADSVLCTDMSEKMLAVAEKNAARQGIANISFEKRNIFHLADEDETYDVVIAGNVLHLLANPEGAVRELWRVTKKGGRLLLPTFILAEGKNSFSEQFKQVMLRAYKLVGFNPATDYTPASYKKMLTDCGLGEVKVKLIRGMMPCCFAVIKKSGE